MDRLLDATSRAEARHFWFRGLRRFVQPLLDAAIAGRDRPRVLDAGCGTGWNLHTLAALAGGVGVDLSRAGLEVVRLTYTNASLFPLVLAARVAQRLAGRSTPENTGLEISVPPAPVNVLLDGVLAAEATLLRGIDLPFGSSLLCAARKPGL